MKKTLFALVLICTMTLSGCSAAWLSTFDGYLKIAGPILIQILDIVALAQGKAPDAALQAKITADQAAVNVLASSVSAASAANLPGTCAAFNQAVTTFSGDLGAIESLANVGGKTSGEIAAAIGIAQSAIQEIEVPIASCQSAPSPVKAMAILHSAALKVTSPSEVVSRFNSVVDSKHHVHLHSAAVRFMTLGIAK